MTNMITRPDRDGLPNVSIKVSEYIPYGTEFVEGVGFAAEAERTLIFNETEDLRITRALRTRGVGRRWRI